MQRVNTAALVEGLKLEVSSNFPFLEGETFEEWISRANQLLNPSQRAMLAASIGTVQRKLVAERSAQKRAWIAAARLEFQPGRRQACFVCGGFEPADSDEVARVYRYEVARGFRDDVAHLSDLISPGGEAF